MYQFNSEIDKLLTNLNRRKPNTTGLFRGGGLPKGGGLSNSRGGGIPGMRSGIPDGGFKTRPKTIRDEMQRTEGETKSESDNDPVSDAASESDSNGDAAAAVLSGKNSALGQSGQPQTAKPAEPASSGLPNMTPATKASFDKAVAGVADNSKAASREDVNFFVRPAGEHSWLHLGAGNKNARTVFGNFIGQPQAVTPWHFQGGKHQAHVHLKPRNLKGALQGYAILAVRGDRGRAFATSRQTAAEWKLKAGSGWTPPKKTLSSQPDESKASELTQRQLNMGAALPLNATAS